jgi:hypothetical protein
MPDFCIFFLKLRSQTVGPRDEFGMAVRSGDYREDEPLLVLVHSVRRKAAIWDRSVTVERRGTPRRVDTAAAIVRDSGAT